MAELSKSTACPVEFKLLSFFDVEEPQSVETQIHASLAKYRVNSLREFFRAPLYEIIDEFRKWIEPWDGVFMDTEARSLSEAERDKDEKIFKMQHFFTQNIDHIHWSKNLGFDC